MRGRPYKCDDCGHTDEFSSYKKARNARWAVAKDYSKCYCPNCAPTHRLGGANKKPKQQTELPKGYQQLGIGDL